MTAAVTNQEEGVYVTLPQLVALRSRAVGFSFLPRQPIHSLLAGRHASRLRGRGLNFEEIRRYLPGDDIRRIDWKVTVRTRKTHSRVYTEERERCVLLVVDQRRSMFFGSQRNMKSVTAAEAAALAAWRVLQQKDRVGAIVFNDTEIEEVRPQRSEAGVLRALQLVVKHNRALSTRGVSAPAILNEALLRAARLATHDFLVCLITDSSGADEETIKTVTRIGAHNDVLVAFVYDPLEAELPDAGPLVISDGLRQMEVDTSDRRLRDDFRDRFASNRAQGRKLLLDRDTPVLPLSAAEGTAEQIRLRLGGLRK